MMTARRTVSLDPLLDAKEARVEPAQQEDKREQEHGVACIVMSEGAYKAAVDVLKQGISVVNLDCGTCLLIFDYNSR